MRPKGVNDLLVLWAIRDIPSAILTLPEKGILFLFSAIIGNKKHCDFSFSQLIEIMGASERGLRDYFKILEKKKFLLVKRSGTLGRGKTNKYQLNYGLILSFSNEANSALLAKINEANSAVLEDEIRQNPYPNKANPAGASIERDKRDIKSREGKLSLIVNENSYSEEQKLYDKSTYRFSTEETQDSYRRDIHIQTCFNKFIEWLDSKGRTRFTQMEWDKWFQAERPGKHAKHAPPPAKNEYLEKVMAEHQQRKEEEIKYGMPDSLKGEWEKVRAKLKGQRTPPTDSK